MSDASEQPSLPRLVRFGDLLDEWDEYQQAVYDAKQRGLSRGPVTGFTHLDVELGHALQPGLHILNGASGAGKTAFAGQVAATCGTPALYVSCEMPILELFRRHAARVTGTYLGKFKSGDMHPDSALAHARTTAAALPFLTLVDATRAAAPPSWIRPRADVARGESPHLLIVIDSLHSWVDAVVAGERVNEYEALNAGVAQLRALAFELNCPILCIAERNRASAKEGGLTSGAGSRKIEYGAESVISLNWDKEPSAVSEVKAVTLALDKNRHGAPDKRFHLTFHGALQHFTEAAR